MTYSRLPHEIKSRQELDGSLYELPRRALGKERWAGLIFVIIGTVVGGIGCGPFVPLLLQLFKGSESVGWWIWIGPLMALPFFFVGVGLFLLGLIVILNPSHGEIRVTREHLCYTERFGLLRWTWKRDLAEVDRLVVCRKLNTEESSMQAEDLTHNSSFDAYAIRTEGDGAKAMWVAPGYPRAWIVSLANDLSTIVAAARRGVIGRDESHEVAVVEEDPPEMCSSDGPWQPEPLPLPPDGDRIVFQEHGDGCSFLFRPVGVWQGSKGLMFFALVWNGFMTIFFAAMIYSTVIGRGSGDEIPLIVWPIVGLFFLIGIGILLQALHMGKRQAAIVVTGKEVLVKQIGLFKKKEQRFAASELKAIRVGNSGMAVNDVPIRELQFVLQQKSGKLGLLSEHVDDDLEWVAAILRNYLCVGRSSKSGG